MEVRNASQHHLCLLNLWLGFVALGAMGEKLPQREQAAHPTGKRRGSSSSAQGESAAPEKSPVGTRQGVRMDWDKAGVPRLWVQNSAPFGELEAALGTTPLCGHPPGSQPPGCEHQLEGKSHRAARGGYARPCHGAQLSTSPRHSRGSRGTGRHPALQHLALLCLPSSVPSPLLDCLGLWHHQSHLCIWMGSPIHALSC